MCDAVNEQDPYDRSCVRCTVAGIYDLRRLQIKRSERLGQKTVLALDCCPERGCHEVTGVEKNLRFPSTARSALVPTKKAQLYS